MKTIFKALSLIMSTVLLFSAAAGAYAVDTHTTLAQWDAQYDSIKNNTGVIALTPGADESQMNFAWLSEITDGKPGFKLATNSGMDNAVSVPVAGGLTATGQWANKVSVSGLIPNSVYYYSYSEAGVWSEPASFKTGNPSSFKALLVSDPQIGRSGDESLDEVLLRDSYGWNSALETAFSENPDINFILSAGDQVETAYTNVQYNLYLAPSMLRNVPVASAMGNHDFYFPLYKNHFNNPNEFTGEIIESPGGSGYWFRYGKAVFIVLNSFAPFAANQELLVKQAVAANKDAVWRVVLMHNSIYGPGGGEPGPVNLWRFYAPVFDKYSIDLVLSGHDHAHCRTYPLKNNEIAAKGEGTVYLSENSASGSKYSAAPETAPWYAANCSQLRAPAYSVLEFTDSSLTINTYRADTAEPIDEEYVMKKQEPSGTEIPSQSFFESLIAMIGQIVTVIKASFVF